MNTDISSADKATLASEAKRGEAEGRACRRLGRQLPPLGGGAYAVGFLYGYAAEGQRVHGRGPGAA
jgi:hypothetical protein